MPPLERKPAPAADCSCLGIALLLLAGGAAAFVVSREPGDVSNPDVEFRDEPAATPEAEPEPERQAGQEDRRSTASSGRLRLHARPPPLPAAEEAAAAAVPGGWQYHGSVLLEFPPAIGGARCTCSTTTAMLRAIEKHTRQDLWKRKLGAAGRRLAGLRRRARVRRRCCSGPRAARARAPGASRARRQDRQDPWSRELREPQRVLAAARRRTGSTSARRTAPSTR